MMKEMINNMMSKGTKRGELICVIMAMTVMSSGATYTWNGSATDGDWANAANWNGAWAPTSLSTSDALIFSGSNMPTANLPEFSSSLVASSTLIFNSGGSFDLNLSTAFDQSPITSSARTWLTVGDGAGSAASVTVNLINMNYLSRHDNFMLNYLIHSDGELYIAGNLSLYPDDGKPVTITLNGGRVVSAGFIDSRFNTLPNCFFSFNTAGSTLTATYGGAYANLTAVQADASDNFKVGPGVALDFTDNGDNTFTVSGREKGAGSLFNVFENFGGPSVTNYTDTLTLKTEADGLALGTQWTPHDWTEAGILNVELQHVSNTGGQDWTGRVGKGGNMYSIVLPGIGEITPPQHSEESPWNDDAMTSTVVTYGYNRDDEMQGYGNTYIHGSSAYINPLLDPLSNKPFYCPQLASQFDATNRAYSNVNWGQIPSPSVNRADVMMYTKYRDLGNGVIELVYYFYNFGDVTLESFDTPWMGVRNSIYPNMLWSTSGTNYTGELASTLSVINTPDMGGWMACSQSLTDSTSPAVGLVTGTEQPQYTLAHGGFVGDVNGRDEMLMHVGARADATTGQGFFYRSYLVIGTLEDVPTTCASLVNEVDSGVFEFPESTSDMLSLSEATTKGQTILTHTGVTSVASSYASPIKGSFPLILMKENESGTYVLSTDPYAVCSKTTFDNQYAETNALYETYQDRVIYRPYDDRTEWIELLGYVSPVDPAKLAGEYQRLSTVLGDEIQFVPGEKLDADELMIWTGSPEPSSSNRAPDFGADLLVAASLIEGDTFNGALTATDGDDDPLTYKKQIGPAWLTVNPDGTMTGTPAEADIGLSSFSIRVSDGHGGFDTATLRISVYEVLSVKTTASSTVPMASTNDLAQTQYQSSSATGGWNLSTYHRGLFNGSVGSTDGVAQGTDASQVWLSSYASFTVNFDVSVHSLGYDIMGIQSIFGWGPGGGGRSNQGYEIIATFMDNSTATLAGPAHWNPNASGNYWTTVSISNTLGSAMARGVKAITFSGIYPANAAAYGDYSVAREFDVFGAPTMDPAVHNPEFVPGTSVLNGNFNVQFSGSTGQHYRVETTDDLTSSNAWQVVTDIVSLVTSPVDVSAPMTNSTGFYRVLWLP